MRLSLLLSSLAYAAAALAAARTATAREPRNDLNVMIDVRDYYLHSMPSFGLSDAIHTPLRDVHGTLPSTGPQHFLAFTLDCSYIRADTWEFPLFGFSGGGAVGRSPRVVTGLDGSIAELRPWTSGTFSLLLPGVGLRTKARRWKFGLTLRPVVSVAWMGATVTNGASSIDVGDPTGDGTGSNPVIAATFGARANVEVCRRLDPMTRACLFLEPHVYEYSPLNGGSLGLRWEFGP